MVENIADALTGANPKNWSEKGETLFNFNCAHYYRNRRSQLLEDTQQHNLVRISSLHQANSEPVVREIVRSNLDKSKHKQLLEQLFRDLSHLPDEEKNSILLAVLERINNKELPSPSKIIGEASIGEAWG